jgi:hypothetical protein
VFEPTSRYAKLACQSLATTGPDGAPREIRYVERRFLPPPDAGTTIVEHTVIEGERLDQITAKYLGDPAQFWRVADANGALRPDELTDQPGQRIIIALPQP